ncbi:MAG: hypothetical protein HYW01_06055 [Deltaproteobacteria bacterium]|nr:hypothetical protein [Deltaproteobacteria bacterium]
MIWVMNAGVCPISKLNTGIHKRESCKKSLTVRGTYHGPSGYDHHVSEFVRELHNQGIKVGLIDIPYWYPVRLGDDKLDPWFYTLDQQVDSSIVLHFCIPPQAKLFYRDN